jgi:hypothetical protein
MLSPFTPFLEQETLFMTTDQHMAALSRLVLQGYDGDFTSPKTDVSALDPELEYVSSLKPQELAEFLDSSNTHHVLVRALQVLERAASSRREARIEQWCREELQRERERITHAVDFLVPICIALEAAGSRTCVIKSLDHWPDLGSDLDLYTSGHPDTVRSVMESKFQGKLEDRSWGDRLANKFNFSVPGLPELIEIHVQYLGQTGEHKAMAQRVIERSVLREVGGHTFRVPAPEERIVISTLQRMYRHFYFRLCDMADVSNLLQQRVIDFSELRKAADAGGIWPGVASFLHLVQKYVQAYGGQVDLPQTVLDSVRSPQMRVALRANFLRVPLIPSASLYGRQLLRAGAKRDVRAMCRLPLLPPLAVSALVAFRLTGTDKGIW